MLTSLAVLLDRCGLSRQEAADYLGRSLDTVKSWVSGRNPTPPDVTREFIRLYATIEKAVEAALERFARYPAGTAIKLMLAPDLEEAQELGWPTIGTQAAALGLIVARCPHHVEVNDISASLGRTFFAGDFHGLKLSTDGIKKPEKVRTTKIITIRRKV